MPVTVPTADEGAAALNALQDQLDALTARVTALEAGTDVDPPDPEPEPPDPPVTTGRACILTIGSATHVFTQDGGTDLGTYEDPQGRFAQHCIAARSDTLPDVLVMFRPDADGKREEVVVEFGRCLNNADQQYNYSSTAVIGAYTATIKQDDTVLATVQVPTHYFYSRWRWQSAPRPVTVKAADLIAAKLVPNLDKTLVPGLRAAVHTDDGPMQPNGITPYMPQTGERDDIGILTESQADYLMYEDEQGLQTIRAWVEGSAAFPWHERDEETFAPINFVDTYPLVSSYEGPYGPPHLPVYYTYENALSPDSAHAPDCGYIPFLLTGDPYALEELQFATTHDYVAQSSYKNYCINGGVRAYAWHMRHVAHCVAATPDHVPKWLQPKSYWQKYLSQALDWSLAHGPEMPAGTWQHDFGYMAPEVNTGGEIPFFTEEYLCGVYHHMVDLGLGWEVMRDWKDAGLIARTNGTSGWNRSIPVAYIVQVAKGSPTAEVCKDWTDKWDYNYTADVQGYYANADLTQAHLAPDVSYGYCTYTMACLNWAKAQGVPDIDTSRNWMRTEMAGHIGVMRWAFA